ncbi:phospholipase C, phosphocholine-specific [Pedobacter sp. BS3]|uniref:phosphocholine-specific phospholipase C n=1 Tax=Pedobacter sp. BS3 TaxID=2567937 RepID=UPI0011EFEA6F|nr:phospholipase C, phosphocholine-specific [Pedobacter sp. BS3]TZF82299.1 phospholipase C, phosphocholine-specific [Pedobacter sp. BS3]
MDTRREFIRKSLLLSGAAGLSTVIPPSIQRALAINPEPGSTYLDAEHVVILMQENRSFDHCFGSLQGVRGFNDPRAFRLANGNPVWLQTNAVGDTYVPFRLDIRNTKATWMGSLPHDRSSQVDAYNNGLHDKWLLAKRPSNKKYADMPLTLGYYNREDLPFNYALADAFTVCDQNFSSAMTSTWPNRHYMWTGAIREQPHSADSRAHIRNDLDYAEAKWRTFPELLEKNGISWKIYQNDLTCGGGFEGEERAWLSNFICNTLEYFSQYNIKFAERYTQGLQEQLAKLPAEISVLEKKLEAMASTDSAFEKTQKAIEKKREVLANAQAELRVWTKANYDKLPQSQKNLFEKAFTTNKEDPDYHTLAPLTYSDNGTERTVTIPKGDIFHQFRKDVNTGKLPAVSWLVAPQRFSDHPSAPWYGSWYVSEVLDILTENPEVWKKTIFILTYDENDGYFDHVPPFMPPHPTRPNTGKCSAGIDTAIEYIPLEQELKFGVPEKSARGAHIGLGYRVPMIIASPWSRGGRVNSQVFDHTSMLQFLENFLSKKTGSAITEDNISAWRRTVCGDLTSVFTAYQLQGKEKDFVLKRDPFIEKIYNARYKQEPSAYKALSTAEITQLREDLFTLPVMPEQEKGIRPACALPYQLYADGNLSADGKRFELQLKAAKDIFGKRAAGSPFTVYAPGNFRAEDQKNGFDKMRNWQYAVAAGDSLTDTWATDAFENGLYHLRVYGPNGFCREYAGDAAGPNIQVYCDYEREKGNAQKLSGNIVLLLKNLDPDRDYTIRLTDAYQKNKVQQMPLKQNGKLQIPVNLQKSFGWYDVSVQVQGYPQFQKHYAGHVETGKESFTDPLMGQVV